MDDPDGQARRGLAALRPRRLPGSAFARGVALLAGGTALAQVVGFAAAPFLTRLYDPKDFGTLAVFTSIVAIWGVVSSLRYEYAVPLPEDGRVAADIMGVGALVLVLECLIGLPVVAFAGPPLFRALNVDELSAYWWLFPVAVFVAGVYVLLYFWAIRQRAYRGIAATKLSQALWRAGLQLGLGALHVAPFGLLAGQVAGGAAGSIALWRRAGRGEPGAFSGVTWAGVRGAAGRYVRFATYGSASGLLNALGLQLTPLVFAHLYGAGETGLYALTQRVLLLPLWLVGVAIGEAYLGTAPRLLRERPDELRGLFLRLTRRLLLFGLVPTLVLVAFGPWLFAFVFGEEWRVAGEYARLLAPAALLAVTVSPLGQTANIFERQDLQALSDLARVVMLVAVFVAAALLGWGPGATVAGVSAATVASYALNFGLYWRLLRVRVSASQAGREG